MSTSQTLTDLSLDSRTDIPSQKPIHPLPLESVGSAGARIVTSVFNPWSELDVDVMLEITVASSLGEIQRGAHMSRFQEALTDAAGRRWKRIESLVEQIARDCKGTQVSSRSTVRCSGSFGVFHKTPVTQRATQSIVDFTSQAVITESACMISLGLHVPIMTACPCTLAYSRLVAEAALTSARPDLDLSAIPLPPTYTHSQPGWLDVEITCTHELPTLKQLYDTVAPAVTIRESVLKRPDEHALVRKAHERPQFCEDVVREVAFAIASLLQADDEISVRAVLDESIHPHQAFAVLKCCTSDVNDLQS